jgi:hypothetical protein
MSSRRAPITKEEEGDDDDDDDELQSEIEAEHASTRIQQRETRGTFRMVNPRQRKQVRNNNPQSADNQRPTAHTQ